MAGTAVPKRAFVVQSTGKDYRVKELGLTTSLVRAFLLPAAMAKGKTGLDPEMAKIVEETDDKGEMLSEFTIASTERASFMMVKTVGEPTKAEADAMMMEGRREMTRFRVEPLWYAIVGFNRFPDYIDKSDIKGIEAVKRALEARPRHVLKHTLSVTYLVYRPSGVLACLF